MFLVTDLYGIMIALHYKILCYSPIYKIKYDVVMKCEAGWSKYIMDHNWKIDSMLSLYKNVNSNVYRNPNEFLSKSLNIDPFENDYFGMTIHPYETIFVKENRYLTGERKKNN